MRNLYLFLLLVMLAPAAGNAQTTWTQLPFDPSLGITKIQMLNASQGYAIAEDNVNFVSQLFFTSDGGQSWSPITFFPADDPFVMSMDWFDVNNGVIAFLGFVNFSLHAKVAVTTDGGSSWNTVSNDSTNFYGGLKVQKPAPNHVFFANDTLFQASVDNGATWDSLGPMGGVPQDIAFPDTTSGFIATRSFDFSNSGTMRSTQDGGQNFVDFTLPDSGSAFMQVDAIDGNTAHAISGFFSDTLSSYTTTTGGMMPWQKRGDIVSLVGDTLDFPEGLGFTKNNPDQGFFSSGDSAIYETTDGGQTWTLSQDVGKFINDFSFVDSSGNDIGMAGGYDGGLFRTQGVASNVQQGVQATPTAIRIYPNPSNDETIIQWRSRHADAVLTIYDATGREVLRTAVAPMGVTRIDTQPWENGVYIVKIDHTARTLVIQH